MDVVQDESHRRLSDDQDYWIRTQLEYLKHLQVQFGTLVSAESMIGVLQTARVKQTIGVCEGTHCQCP